MKNLIIICFLAIFATCGCGRNEISNELEIEIKNNNSEKVDLSKVGGSSWDRVCIFGPYSDNISAEKALGFRWDIENKTSIFSSDTVNVLVFAKGKAVIEYTEYPRSLGDFEKLSGQCFSRTDAMFVRNKQRKDNWVSFISGK